MRRFLAEVRNTLSSKYDPKQGSVAQFMLALTLVIGLVDAFSYLAPGHVFVANMTGNIVFLGFALAGAKDFSILASLCALVSFWAGAAAGGELGSRIRERRDLLLCAAAAIQAVFLLAAVIFTLVSSYPLASGYRYALIIALGVAMGVQNTATRNLAIPDLTTTVLTLTITGMGADSTLAGGPGSKLGRRLVAIVTMLAGAAIGASLLIHVSDRYTLLLAFLIVGFVAVTSGALGRSRPTWTDR